MPRSSDWVQLLFKGCIQWSFWLSLLQVNFWPLGVTSIKFLVTLSEENKGNVVSSLRNVQRTVWRICMLILAWKGLIESRVYLRDAFQRGNMIKESLTYQQNIVWRHLQWGALREQPLHHSWLSCPVCHKGSPTQHPQSADTPVEERKSWDQ